MTPLFRNKFLCTLTKVLRHSTPNTEPQWPAARNADESAFIEAMKQYLNVIQIRFDLMMAATSEGLWDMDVIAGDPVNPVNTFWWSPQFRQMLGFQDENDFPNVLGSWASRLHPEDSERTLNAFAAHLNDRSGKTPYDITYRLKMKHGEYRWFHARGATSRDPDGIPIRVAGSLSDITVEHLRAIEREMIETRFELARDMMIEGLWDMGVVAGDPVNPNNAFWWSPQFRKMLGFTNASDFPDVLGSWASRLHPDEKDRVIKAFADHLNDRSGRTPYNIEYRLKLKNGQYRWFRAAGQTRRDKDGVPLRVVGALIDIQAEKEVAEIIGKIAAGDLCMDIALDTNDGKNAKANIKNMIEKLSQVIRDVLGSADALVSACQQVSSTAQMLSQASSDQAASVEETSASIEQMAASIQQNTENAKVTDGMAAKAAKEANQGGVEVKQTVQAMKDIANKIGIIDDIAYQTNMLALNAAIEAARAGDHGKGFAVVAAEVRKLAERSQIAAKEIGELAQSSVKTAESAGKLLDEIVPSIGKTSDLVQEITAVSQEQATSVKQVHTAIAQMSHITQQNASSSEELAATAEEMTSQAEQLQNLMSFFKIARA